MTADNCAWVAVRSLEDFGALRTSQSATPSHWWPDIGPHGDTGSFSFMHRMRRLGPITVLDINFHDDVWVNGREVRPHYHVTVPAAASVMGKDSRPCFVRNRARWGYTAGRARPASPVTSAGCWR